MTLTEERRICWPDPDATCLEGGCQFCNYEPFRSVAQIERYARRAGVLPQRASGRRLAIEAFEYGRSNHWNLASSRHI